MSDTAQPTEGLLELVEQEKQSRVKLEVNTSAKGDVNVSFTIEVHAGLTIEEHDAMMDRANGMATEAAEMAADIKRIYMLHLADAVDRVDRKQAAAPAAEPKSNRYYAIQEPAATSESDRLTSVVIDSKTQQVVGEFESFDDAAGFRDKLNRGELAPIG